MKTYWLKFGLAVLLLNVACIARADTATVIQNPADASQKFKDAWNLLNPSADWYFNNEDGTTHNGTSIRLLAAPSKWKYGANALELRAGWADEQIGFLAIGLNLATLTGIDQAKYVHLSFAGSKSLDSRKWGWGEVVGVKAQF